MSTDELDTPLGQDKTRKTGSGFKVGFAPVAATVLGLSLAVFAGWTILVDDPLGGEPMAVANAAPSADTVTKAEATEALATAPANGAPAGAGQPAAAPGTKTVTIIDGTSGSRRDVVIPARRATATPHRRRSALHRAVAPRPAAEDRAGRHAAVGRLRAPGQAGRARQEPTDRASRSWSAGSASARTPPPTRCASCRARSRSPSRPMAAISSGRSPARARPGTRCCCRFRWSRSTIPTTIPGPQTLLTSIDAGQNLDRLHWLMSRFQGYVGIVNYMGGRFTRLRTGAWRRCCARPRRAG